MLVDSLSGRLQVTLSLTIVARVKALLLQYSSVYVILKGTVACTVIISQCQKMIDHPYVENHVENNQLKIILVDLLDLFKSLASLLVVQLALASIAPSSSSSAGWGSGGDFAQQLHVSRDSAGLSIFSHISLSIWPMIESFVLSSVTIVCMTSAVRMWLHTTATSDGQKRAGGLPQTMARVFTSVQYSFADSVSGMVTDPTTQRLIGIAGMIFFPNLVARSDAVAADASVSSVRVWTESVCMAWMNIVVQLVLPAQNWNASSVPVEICTVLATAVILQSAQIIVPELQTLQGYLEWTVAAVIMSRAAEQVQSCSSNILESRKSCLYFLIHSQRRDGRGSTWC